MAALFRAAVTPVSSSTFRGSKSSWLNCLGCANVFPMSATELIRQMAELPPHERTLFEQLLRGLPSVVRPAQAGAAAPASWPDFAQRLRRIYGEKVAPDSQSIIDEGRGDR